MSLRHGQFTQACAGGLTSPTITTNNAAAIILPSARIEPPLDGSAEYPQIVHYGQARKWSGGFQLRSRMPREERRRCRKQDVDAESVRVRLEELRTDLLKRSVRNPSSSRSSSGRVTAGAVLEDVVRALRMLDTGAYGICERCGEPISPDRLDAYPAARFCVKDQQSRER